MIGFRLVAVLDPHHVVEPGFLAHRVDVDLLAAELVHHADAPLVVRAREPARLVHRALQLPRQEGPVDPRQGRAVALHAEEEDFDVADLAVDVLVHLGADVARVGREQQGTPPQADEVSRLARDVQVRVLAEERDRGDRPRAERQLVHIGDFHDVAEAAMLEHQPQRRVLERPGDVARHDHRPDSPPQLQERLEQDVVLVVVRDQGEVDRLREVVVSVPGDVGLVGVAQDGVEQDAHVLGFQ